MRLSAAGVAILATILVTSCLRETARTGDVTFEALPAAPALPLSRFSVPMRYDFTQVLGIVDRAVPRRFGSLDTVHRVGDDEHRHYSYEATRGPFVIYAAGKVVHLRSTLSYTARGYYKPPIGPTLSAGCGDDSVRPRIIIDLVTPLSLGTDWHLKTHARLAALAPASDSARDHCAVSILRYDVTDRVVDAAQDAVAKNLAEIDRKVAGVDLKSHFTEWWGLLNKPIGLADNVWLLLEPERARLGSVRGDGHVLVIEAGLDARPRIVTGPEPAVVPKPLPPLARDTSFDGFHILMEGVIDYLTASRAITDALRSKEVSQAGRIVRVTSVRVSPSSGGKLALSVSFDGDARGTLVFIGTPRYDARDRALTVPDLDYDLRSDDQLINTYSWLRSEVLRASFRERARVPVQPILERGRSLLLAGLNRKLGEAVTLSATVDSVSVKGLYVTREGVVVRADANGNAGMSVKQR